jgi:glucose-1-phosphate cytidylyltransferase
VSAFQEKPTGDGGWINGGFFVLEPGALEYVDGDHTIWERQPLEQLAAQGRLAAFRHSGFWMAMDTLRDKQALESYWEQPDCPWRVWARSKSVDPRIRVASLDSSLATPTRKVA